MEWSIRTLTSPTEWASSEIIEYADIWRRQDLKFGWRWFGLPILIGRATGLVWASWIWNYINSFKMIHSCLQYSRTWTAKSSKSARRGRITTRQKITSPRTQQNSLISLTTTTTISLLISTPWRWSFSHVSIPATSASLPFERRGNSTLKNFLIKQK